MIRKVIALAALGALPLAAAGAERTAPAVGGSSQAYYSTIPLAPSPLPAVSERAPVQDCDGTPTRSYAPRYRVRRMAREHRACVGG